MPNPYHDDQGRFCSAGEMNASIARLTEKGDYYTAQKMSEEFNRYQIIGAKTPDTARVATLKTKLTASAGVEGNLALNIIATQDASNADITEALKEVKNEKTAEQETLTTIQNNLNGINGTVETESGGLYKTVAELDEANRKDEIEKNVYRREILTQLEQRMIKAGIPRNYVRNYLDRKAPALGFGDYVNSYNNEVVPAEPAYPVHADSKIWNSVTRPAEYRTLIKEVVNEMEKEGQFNGYNNNLGNSEQRTVMVQKYRKPYYDLVREAGKIERNISAKENVISGLEKVQTWRKNLKTQGISEYATLLPARGVVVSKITKDDQGNINNLYGFTSQGETERIVKAVPGNTGHPESGVLVGERNGKYASQTHYANYKSSSSDSYVILDPTTKGKPYFGKDSEIKTFYSEIDSGD